MNESETQQDGRLELSDEQRESVRGRLEEIAGQLDQLAGERDAVLAGVDELRGEFGDEAVSQVAGELGVDLSGDTTAAMQAQVAASEEARLAALAEVANVRRRSAQNEQQARTQGQRSAVQNLLGVLDHFDLTLGHVNPESATAAQVLEGVGMIRAEMIRVLGTMGVEVLHPEAGDAFEPGRHQAIAQQPSGEVEAGCVMHLARAGYAIEGQIIRPAEVVVASAMEGADDADNAGGSEEGED